MTSSPLWKRNSSPPKLTSISQWNMTIPIITTIIIVSSHLLLVIINLPKQKVTKNPNIHKKNLFIVVHLIIKSFRILIKKKITILGQKMDHLWWLTVSIYVVMRKIKYSIIINFLPININLYQRINKYFFMHNNHSQ